MGEQSETQSWEYGERIDVTFQASAGTFQELVENVETTLSLTTYDHPTLLQQIPVNVRTSNAAVRGETDLDKLSETTRVVIPLCLSITEGFKDRIGLENLIFDYTETIFGR